jgi:hypothetical protein
MEEGFKACPFCAEPIREAARICRFCNRNVEPVKNSTVAGIQAEDSRPPGQPVPANVQWHQDKVAPGQSSGGGRFVFGIVALSLVLIAVFAGIAQMQRTAQGLPSGSPSFIPHPVRFAVLNGDLAVGAGTVTSIPFSVPPGATGARLNGTFQSAGGYGNDIEACVTTTLEFENWENGHMAHGYYFSGKTTTGQINVGPLPPGDYVLGFSNKFSVLTSKTVSGTVTLNYLH